MLVSDDFSVSVDFVDVALSRSRMPSARAGSALESQQDSYVNRILSQP